MPIPKPRVKESQSEFISRCVMDSVMKREYPDKKQRLAVCYSSWRKSMSELKMDDKKKKKTFAI